MIEETFYRDCQEITSSSPAAESLRLKYPQKAGWLLPEDRVVSSLGWISYSRKKIHKQWSLSGAKQKLNGLCQNSSFSPQFAATKAIQADACARSCQMSFYSNCDLSLSFSQSISQPILFSVLFYFPSEKLNPSWYFCWQLLLSAVTIRSHDSRFQTVFLFLQTWNPFVDISLFWMNHMFRELLLVIIALEVLVNFDFEISPRGSQSRSTW